MAEKPYRERVFQLKDGELDIESDINNGVNGYFLYSQEEFSRDAGRDPSSRLDARLASGYLAPDRAPIDLPNTVDGSSWETILNLPSHELSIAEPLDIFGQDSTSWVNGLPAVQLHGPFIDELSLLELRTEADIAGWDRIEHINGNWVEPHVTGIPNRNNSSNVMDGIAITGHQASWAESNPSEHFYSHGDGFESWDRSTLMPQLQLISSGPSNYEVITDDETEFAVIQPNDTDALEIERWAHWEPPIDNPWAILDSHGQDSSLFSQELSQLSTINSPSPGLQHNFAWCIRSMEPSFQSEQTAKSEGFANAIETPQTPCLEPSGACPRPKTSSRTPKAFGWENTTFSQYQQSKCSVLRNAKRKAGRRLGHLDANTARHARIMRGVGACLPCRLSRTKCSTGAICSPCLTHQRHSPYKIICTKERLVEYCQLFFPALLVSHLASAEHNALAKKVVLDFLGDEIEAYLNCGHGLPFLNLKVAEFIPASDEELAVPTIKLRTPSKVPTFETKRSRPLAIRNPELKDLVRKCREYVRCVCEHQRSVRQAAVPRSTSNICRLTLEAILRYECSLSQPDHIQLLEKSMMLHEANLFMSRTITFTGDIAANLWQPLATPVPRTNSTNRVSKPLNKQIKCAMHSLIQELTLEVLEEVEEKLNTRKPELWVTCFCVIAILCICMENIQIATDGLVMHTRTHNTSGCGQSLEDAIHVCRILDAKPFAHLIYFFHKVYKSDKPPSRDRLYNHLRDDPCPNDNTLNQVSLDFVNDMRSIISTHDASLTERAKPPTFGSGHVGLVEHKAFQHQNSARLLSSFLKSFQITGSRS